MAIFGHIHHRVQTSENGERRRRAGAIFIWAARTAMRTLETVDGQEGAMAKVEHTTQIRHVYKRVQSPVGTLTLVASEEGLAAILWERDRPRRVRLNIVGEDSSHPALVETEHQLEEYFGGRRKQFELRLDPSGTPFQRTVWRALTTIPFGETRSYAQIAKQIGHTGAARAVGAANARNPLSIVAPCHRVVGSTGALTGFAGGLDVKAHLLALEARSASLYGSPGEGVI
jgi:methylated-DNA-[protein]-cysteine S-methyltransferase